MPKIAISYRRIDSTVIAGRILDRLSAHYGSDSVFMDVHSIPYGTDFRDYIQKALAGIDVLLAIIGPQWLGDSSGNPSRISEGEDLVRIEVETALKRGVLVIPVLISGATMPSSDQLPPSLKALADRNAAIVDGGRDFHPHMEGLIGAIDQMFPHASPKTSDRLAQRMTGNVALQPQAEPGAPLSSLLGTVFGAVFCVLVAHYVLVIVLDLNTLYLRVASIVIPFFYAFLSYQNARPSVTPAVVVSLSIALLSVTFMTLLVGWSFGKPVLPATRYEWRETMEYIVTIGGSFFAGYLLTPSIGRLSFWRKS